MSKMKPLAASIAALVIPSIGFAAALEEVVVTAQKRAESINEVGLSVSAATGAQLEAMGVDDAADLVKVSPGLVFTSSQNGTPLFSLRGVGFNDYTLGASPAVSVYVDEVPLAYGAFSKGASLDLERVEVLKGPQGLLFGQNSTGGAINYIAAKPTREFEAGVDVSYGRFNRSELGGYASGGLTETLSARVAVNQLQSDEWQSSTSRDDELGAEDVFKGRLQLQWQATDNATFLLGINGWRDKSDPQAGQLQGLMLQYETPPSPGSDTVETQRRIDTFNALEPAGQNARDTDWGMKPERDDDFHQVTLLAEVELTDELVFNSITAYAEYNEDYYMDRDGTTLDDAGIDSFGQVYNFSQELRLSGTTDTLQWLVGINYASSNVDSNEAIQVTDSTNTAIIPGGPWIGTGYARITQDIRDLGIFTNLEYSVTDQITVLAGVRYTENENDYSFCERPDPGLQVTFPAISDLLRGLPPGTSSITLQDCSTINGQTFAIDKVPYEDSLDEDNVSWRLGLNYSVSPDLLLYGLASKGYKTGSFPLLPAATTTQLGPVTQESVLAFELGAKWSLLDQSTQLNGALFHYKYEDKQVRGVLKDPVFNQLDRLVNIPESTIQGLELELVTSPLDGLVIRLSGTYVDSEVDEFYTFVNALTGQSEVGINGVREQRDFAGSELPFTPKLQMVGDVEYRWPLTDSLNAFIGGNVLHNSDANSTFGDPEETRIDAFTTLDLRAGIASSDGHWTASIWGRNVTDEYYWTNQFVTQDVVVRFAAKPVTYGASFSYKFF